MEIDIIILSNASVIFLGKMPRRHIVLKKETRMVGASQIMIGLLHCALGYIWLHLFIRQSAVLSQNHVPITLISGYPFGAFLFYAISGILAIEAEKKRSPKLLTCTIRMNTFGIFFALLGPILNGLEITLFLIKGEKMIWPNQISLILSVYSWMFSILEFFLANTVIRFGHHAFHHGKHRP